MERKVQKTSNQQLFQGETEWKPQVVTVTITVDSAIELPYKEIKGLIDTVIKVEMTKLKKN